MTEKQQRQRQRQLADRRHLLAACKLRALLVRAVESNRGKVYRKRRRTNNYSTLPRMWVQYTHRRTSRSQQKQATQYTHNEGTTGWLLRKSPPCVFVSNAWPGRAGIQVSLSKAPQCEKFCRAVLKGCETPAQKEERRLACNGPDCIRNARADPVGCWLAGDEVIFVNRIESNQCFASNHGAAAARMAALLVQPLLGCERSNQPSSLIISSVLFLFYTVRLKPATEPFIGRRLRRAPGPCSCREAADSRCWRRCCCRCSRAGNVLACSLRRRRRCSRCSRERLLLQLSSLPPPVVLGLAAIAGKDVAVLRTQHRRPRLYQEYEENEHWNWIPLFVLEGIIYYRVNRRLDYT